MRRMNFQQETITAVNAAWRHAQEKWGNNLGEHDPGTRLSILVEAVDKASSALNKRLPGEELASKLYDVAAMALASAERLDERQAERLVLINRQREAEEAQRQADIQAQREALEQRMAQGVSTPFASMVAAAARTTSAAAVNPTEREVVGT